MTATVLTPTKAIGSQNLYAIAAQATAVVLVGAPIDVSGKFAALVGVKYGRTIATALGNEVLFRLEASFKGSADDSWYPILLWSSSLGKTACNSTTLSAGPSAGDGTVAVTSNTGIAAGTWLYIHEATIANSEWIRCKSISGTTVTLENNLTRAHTNGANIATLAESFAFPVDLRGVGRLRLVVDSNSNGASGQTVDVIGEINTLDSIAGT